MNRLNWRHLAVGAAAAVLAAAVAFPAAAASRKKITAITLTFEANIQPGMEYGEEDIEIEGSGDRFSVDGDYVIKNDGFEWEADSVPQLEVTLTAEEGYYFSSLPKDKLRLKGAGATYVKGVRQDDYETLVMTVTLNSLQKSLGEMENVLLTSDGIASWDKMETAGSYELRVYRDDKSVGASIITSSTSYSCAEKMTKSANYYMKVRPINKADPTIIGAWKESGRLYIDKAAAEYFRANPVENPEGVRRPGSWKQSADGRYWYDNGDGTYPQACWMQIGDKEYYFDQDGYMKTGWIEWEGKRYFCAENGEKLKNCMTSDNYWLGEDGAVINQEPDNQAN